MMLMFDVATLIALVVILPLFIIYLGWHYETQDERSSLLGIKDPDPADYVFVGVLAAVAAGTLPTSIGFAIVGGSIFGISRLVTRKVNK